MEILTAIVALVSAIISFIKSFFTAADDTGETGKAVWDAVKGVGSSVVDWWQDPETDKKTKVALAYGAAHLIAPDMTERFTDNVVDAGVSLVDSMSSGVSSIAKSLFSNPAFIFAGIGLFLLLRKGKPTAIYAGRSES